MGSKYYVGRREKDGWVVEVDGNPLDPRKDLAKYSQSFAWGYSGGGPSRLALALLADYLGDDRSALLLHKDFRDQVILELPQNHSWALTKKDLESYLEEVRWEVSWGY